MIVLKGWWLFLGSIVKMDKGSYCIYSRSEFASNLKPKSPASFPKMPDVAMWRCTPSRCHRFKPDAFAFGRGLHCHDVFGHSAGVGTYYFG
jgi:hypothetical protein